MKSTYSSRDITETDHDVLRCLVHATFRNFVGTWQVGEEPLVDCPSPIGLPVSFDYIVHFQDSNYVIYPDDLAAFKALVDGRRQDSNVAQVRLVAQDGRVLRLELEGMFMPADGPEGLHSARAQGRESDRRPYKGEVDWRKLVDIGQYRILIEAVIQSDNIALSVLKPVYDEAGAIVDFEWLIANKLLKALAQGQAVVARRYTEVFPASVSNGVLDVLRAVFATGERQTGEVYYENHNVRGWYRQVYTRAQDSVVVSAEDITLEKKKQEQILHMNQLLAQRAQQQYQELFQSIDQGFALLQMLYDAQGNAVDCVYLQVNPAFEKITGVANVAGQKLTSLGGAHSRVWINAYQQVVAMQAPVQLIMPGDQQEAKYYEVYAFPTGEAEACTVAVLLSDVTARHVAARQLQALNDQLQQMDRAKTRFFSNVSHEFRTSLTLIQGPMQDLLRADSGLGAEHRRTLSIAERNVVRLLKLVNSLLDFSRVEAGRLDALFQPTRLAEFTGEIAANFRPLVERAGLKFVIKGDVPSEPIYINREMWEKIVLNLLSNAFKFTHAGKIEVKLREKKFGVELSVRDTGIGIARKDQPRIFERFYRQENARARTYEGTGIGLALVRELVDLHGGTIKVKSEEGVGTTFTVTVRKGKAHLPARQIFETATRLGDGNTGSYFAQEAASWLPETSYGSGPARGEENKPLIVVADDNADMRAYLANILSPYYRVMSADHGRKVLDLLHRGIRPSLIVSDVMMPEVDGYGLVSALRNDAAFADIPVILLSAYTGEEAAIEALHRGAVDFVEKPFSSRTLRAFIEARLRPGATDVRRAAPTV